MALSYTEFEKHVLYRDASLRCSIVTSVEGEIQKQIILTLRSVNCTQRKKDFKNSEPLVLKVKGVGLSWPHLNYFWTLIVHKKYGQRCPQYD